MKRLSSQARQMIVEKALGRKGQPLTEVAESHNIGYSTLQKWIKRYRDNAQDNGDKGVRSKTKINQADQFKHLVAISNLDESALGAYCREHGLYSFQLKQWKEEFMGKNKDQKTQKDLAELKALRTENKLLKQELRRKESALAETAALLILKKKANSIWGVVEDD